MSEWSDKRVEGVGPVPAKIMLIGEAPGENEDKQGIPFVGTAGRVLDGILEEVGIVRGDIYITNLCKNRPKNNNFEEFTDEYLAKAKSELEEEIARVQPNVIVAVGEKSFRHLSGKANITQWRGSVLSDDSGRKLIPTIHPAAIMREWSFRPPTVADFSKIKHESEYSDIRRKERKLWLMPKFDEVTSYLARIISGKNKCAFDIETETTQISCISFAVSAEESMCIPFWFGASGSLWPEEKEQVIWGLIKQLLEDESIPKIAQNAQYDITVLSEKYGIRVKGLCLDTMIAFHALYPELPKNLGFLSSLYTDVPYYKFLRKTDDMVKFFEYNALDAVVTYECGEFLYAEMKDFGVLDFYYEHMHSLIYPLMHITHTGVKIDTELKKGAIKKYRQEIDELQAQLDAEVGYHLNINSPKQMQKWLYEELKIPVKYKLRKGKDAKTVSADAESVEECFRETGNPHLKTVLAIRERKKILSTYLEVTYDKEKDGGERARTSYNIAGTETGRLSSSETVFGTGTNLQNIPKGIARRIFIPDDGKTFVNADLSQAEARVVAYLAEEDRLINVFNNGGDIHRKNASNIFHKPASDITKEERELAKRVVHASNYGMGPVTFSRTAGISIPDAKKLLNQYFAEYPRIKIWHMQIQSRLKKTRTLVTPFGRKRTFFSQWGDGLIKEAYAYIPQSTVADLLNMGLRRLYAKYKDTPTQILLQIHDAVLLQCPSEMAMEVAKEVKDTLTIPVSIGSRQMVIPCDIQIGTNWDELSKVSV